MPVSFSASRVRVLDAFRHDGQVKLGCEIDDSLDQLSAMAGSADGELPVDLDVIERKTLQQGEIAVIRTKIVDRVFYAMGPETHQIPVTGGQTVEQSALRDLKYDLESCRLLPEGRSEVMRKAVRFNMLRGEIDVDPEALAKAAGLQFRQGRRSYIRARTATTNIESRGPLILDAATDPCRAGAASDPADPYINRPCMSANSATVVHPSINVRVRFSRQVPLSARYKASAHRGRARLQHF
jgi:hypothetical protein